MKVLVFGAIGVVGCGVLLECLRDAGTLALGRFGWWTGIGPDDSVLALRDISLEEIYALGTRFP